MFEHTSSALVRVVERASLWETNATCSAAWTTVHSIYEKLILSPLARLYLYGPSLGGWGFWNGLGMHVICAQKTNLLPDFWEHHPFECAQIVSKQFYSSVVFIETFVYFFIIWRSVSCLLGFLKNKLNSVSHGVDNDPQPTKTNPTRERKNN
jgi:hypothetical protein